MTTSSSLCNTGIAKQDTRLTIDLDRLGGVSDNSILVQPSGKSLVLGSVKPTKYVSPAQLELRIQDEILTIRHHRSSPSWIISCLKCADPGQYAQPGDKLAQNCVIQDAHSKLYVSEWPANKLTLQKAGNYNQLFTFYAK
jgi:hypothetical protein